MLAYAASRPRIGARHSSPNALLAVIALHVGLLAAVMSVKMDLPRHRPPPPLIIDTIPPPQPPPPNQSVTPHQPHQPTFTEPQPQLLLPPTDPQVLDAAPPHPAIDPWPGPSIDPGPRVDPLPLPARIGARLLTPATELKPPYPHSKLLAEEEALLKLRLTIDSRGRVIAVDPIGRADPAFLEAARRHLIAHWRYQPASVGGHGVASTELITLRFQLDG